MSGVLVALVGAGMVLVAKPFSTWKAERVQVWSGLHHLNGVNYNRVMFVLAGLGAVWAGCYLIFSG